MQRQNDTCADPIQVESFYEAIDFPTEEELLAALEASLEQSPWLPRPAATALDITSRNLARRWQELDETHVESLSVSDKDEHYLSSLLEETPAPKEIAVAPDFLAALAKFLMDHILKRMQEVYQAQNQLMEELAKFKS